MDDRRAIGYKSTDDSFDIKLAVDPNEVTDDGGRMGSFNPQALNARLAARIQSAPRRRRTFVQVLWPFAKKGK